jgi:uncharacterized phage-like protein YoqJ
MRYAITGHRPDKLGGYSVDATQRLNHFAFRTMRYRLQYHEEDGTPMTVITGMALGWDMAVAFACKELEIPYIAAIPFLGQEKMWNKEYQDIYFRLLDAAQDIEIVSTGGYQPYKMELRNRWMVDNADMVIALYNGGEEGGTANCVRYAVATNKPVVNVWKEWVTRYA